MNKNLIYRHISVFGSLLLILNLLIFMHIPKLDNLTIFIDLVILPITMIVATIWIKKRIALFGLVIFIIGFTLNIFIKISLFDSLSSYPNLTSIATSIDVFGILILIFSLVSKSNRGYILKALHHPEKWTFTICLSLPIIFNF